MQVYLETSSLLTWLLGEVGEIEIRKILNRSRNIFASIITVIEVERSLIRLLKTGRLNSKEISSARANLIDMSSSWNVMQITPGVRLRCAQEFPVEPLRTLDAVHLATALEFSRGVPNLKVLSNDNRILDNLSGLGLQQA